MSDNTVHNTQNHDLCNQKLRKVKKVFKAAKQGKKTVKPRKGVQHAVSAAVPWPTLFFEYGAIALGCALMALALHFFFEPNTIAPGGVSGLAVLIQRTIGIPMDITILGFNLPLMLLGALLLGKSFGVKTIFASVMISVFLRLYVILFGPEAVITTDVLLATVYGGVALGLGLGLIFRMGGTSGGTALAGAVINKYIPRFTTAKIMMFLDIVIVIVAGMVESQVEVALYSIIALYILVQMSDFVVEGFDYAKILYIISWKPEVVGKKINTEIGRGVTVLSGKGMYTGTKRDVLMCVVTRAQVYRVKRLVYETDPRAFIMVTNTSEVLGEGFKDIKSN